MTARVLLLLLADVLMVASVANWSDSSRRARLSGDAEDHAAATAWAVATVMVMLLALAVALL